MDGVDLRDASHEEAVEAIRRAGNPVSFLFQSIIHRPRVSLYYCQTSQLPRNLKVTNSSFLSTSNKSLVCLNRLFRALSKTKMHNIYSLQYLVCFWIFILKSWHAMLNILASFNLKVQRSLTRSFVGWKCPQAFKAWLSSFLLGLLLAWLPLQISHSQSLFMHCYFWDIPTCCLLHSGSSLSL